MSRKAFEQRFLTTLAPTVVLAVVWAASLGAQEREQPQERRAVVVQPGAPGSPTIPLGPEDLRIPERPVHSEADVLFMQNMIHHHGQALIMAGLAPDRAGSEEIRLLARKVERSQTDEIALMQRWLELRGEAAPSLEHADHHADHVAHHHSATHHPDAERLMAGMLTAEQLAELEAAEGEEFDRLFLEFMIFHHEGALEMVGELMASPGGAQDTDIFVFASHVDSDQAVEIRRMREVLARMR